MLRFVNNLIHTAFNKSEDLEKIYDIMPSISRGKRPLLNSMMCDISYEDKEVYGYAFDMAYNEDFTFLIEERDSGRRLTVYLDSEDCDGDEYTILTNNHNRDMIFYSKSYDYDEIEQINLSEENKVFLENCIYRYIPKFLIHLRYRICDERKRLDNDVLAVKYNYIHSAGVLAYELADKNEMVRKKDRSLLYKNDLYRFIMETTLGKERLIIIKNGEPFSGMDLHTGHLAEFYFHKPIEKIGINEITNLINATGKAFKLSKTYTRLKYEF